MTRKQRSLIGFPALWLTALSMPVAGSFAGAADSTGPPAKVVAVDPIPAVQAVPPSPLKGEPDLQAKITKNVRSPRLEELLALLQEETHLRVTASVENLDDRLPVFGSLSMINIPAWQLMAQIERTVLQEGSWEKVDGGYELRGKALPAFVDEPRGSPEVVVPTTPSRRYLLIGLNLLLVVALLIVCVVRPKRRRSMQSRQANV